MIIFLHGTGDDSTKAENWMPTVARILEKSGELTLVLPGVASSQAKKEHFARILLSNEKDKDLDMVGFKARLLQKSAAPRSWPRPDIPWLTSTLQKAGGELLRALSPRESDPFSDVQVLIDQMKNTESGLSAHGIKLRMALAGLCALAYWRLVREDSLRDCIRIVGHSRGGAAAVGLHNLLTYYNIPCRTLTLDPCHGVRKPLSWNKDYYLKIYSGDLINIPCSKGVSGIRFVTIRDSIWCAPGNPGNAKITPHAILPEIEHGHMGKLKSFGGSDEAKAAARQRLKAALDLLVQADRPLRAHLQSVFDSPECQPTAARDDQRQIRAALLDFLPQRGKNLG